MTFAAFASPRSSRKNLAVLRPTGLVYIGVAAESARTRQTNAESDVHEHTSRACSCQQQRRRVYNDELCSSRLIGPFFCALIGQLLCALIGASRSEFDAESAAAMLCFSLITLSTNIH